MFGFLQKLFGTASKPEPPADDGFRRLNEVAPLKAEAAIEPPAAPTGAYCFVCREAVLDRSERISGYEFSLNRRLQSRLLERSELVQKAYDDGLLRHLGAVGIETLLGRRLAFVHLSPASLTNPLLARLPAANVVVLIDPPTGGAFDPESARLGLAALAACGLRHGWSLRQAIPELMPLLPAADFVQIDAGGFDGVQLRNLVRELRALRDPSLPPTGLIARDLATFDDFNLCFQSGFDHFQGHFVSSRENWRPPKSEINRLRVLELLNLIRDGAEVEAISASLKTEPVLTFKLLRYINSPAMGVQREVTTIAQGLIILGREKFYRWLSLLLFDVAMPGYRERVLTEQALTRGRFMENLAGQGKVPARGDHLFMTGMFSLLDALMGQPLAEVLDQVTLPAAVREALLATPGPFLDALRLAVANESGEPAEIAAAAQACGVDDLTVSRAMFEALDWAHAISGSAQA